MRQKTSVNMEYHTERLIMKILTPDYLREVLAFQLRNKELFERYEPTRPENFYTLSYQQAVLKYELKLAMKLNTIRFYVFRKEDPQTIIGTVCLHEVNRSAYSCSEVGYKFDAAWHHRGYAREALVKTLEIAFGTLGLHRVFARVMPENKPSMRLLEGLGFLYEGIEYDCILIQGKWKDHLRYACISPFSPHT